MRDGQVQSTGQAESPQSLTSDEMKLLKEELGLMQHKYEEERRLRIQAEALLQEHNIVVETANDQDYSELLRFTKEFVEAILNGNQVEYEECQKLEPFLKVERGRRDLAKLLGNLVKKVCTYGLNYLPNTKTPNSILSNNSFEIMLYLINTLLREMEREHRDFITAKKVMKISMILSNTEKRFIRVFTIK